mgnify:FL=1
MSKLAVDERIARVACILFCFSPASIFYVSAYSESLACLLFFGVIYCSICNRDYNFKSSLVSAFLCGLLCIVRSNGLFAIIIVGHKLLLKFFVDLATFLRGHHRRFYTLIQDVGQGIVLLLICILPYSIYLYYPKFLYCHNEDTENLPPDWCKDAIPSWYSHIQNAFWNVGFLQFYQGKNIYFILIGWIFIPIFIDFCFKYYWNDTLNRLLLGIPKALFPPHQETTTTISQPEYLKGNEVHFFSVYLYTLILLTVLIFFAHVNIAARLLSSNPLLYWFAAAQLSKVSGQQKGIAKFSYYQTWILGVFLTGYFLGIVVFSNFFLFV